MARLTANGLDAGALRPGARLGRYQVAGRLGVGGMGVVYRAIDTRLGREVAVKVLGPEAGHDPSRRRRFDREAQLASAVNHPNVITVFDAGEEEHQPYVVTELLEGETLRDNLRPGDLPPRRAAEYGIQIARGLEALHSRGIVHRDIKPENLFVTTDGRIKILDLGLAGPSHDGEPTLAEPWESVTTEGASAGGTAAYMSPEQVRRLPADPRSDIFACGVVLYEMLARRRPFHEETAAETMTAILRREPPPLRESDASLPSALVGVVERCLEKRSEDRFHSAHDLALALEASLEPWPRPSLPPVAPPGSGTAPPASARRPWRALAAGVLLAALGLWRWQAGGGREELVPILAGGPAALVSYDAALGRFRPFLQGLAADGVDFSHDRRWVTYTTFPDGELWRSRVNGKDRLRLTEAPLQAGLPRFSPDGQRIAFAGRTPGRPWQIHLVGRDGGGAVPLPTVNVTDPGWSVDGMSLFFSGVSGEPAVIFKWDLGSGRQTLVPGSEGLFSPRPSPDGRYLAALRRDSMELLILDWSTGRWSQLTDQAVAYPAWTPDGTRLHFRRDGAKAAFFSIDPATRREQRVASIDGTVLASGEWGAWSGLTPDGVPLLLLDLRGPPPPPPGHSGPPVRVDPSALVERKTTR